MEGRPLAQRVIVLLGVIWQVSTALWMKSLKNVAARTAPAARAPRRK